jgi:hypothetical protein
MRNPPRALAGLGEVLGGESSGGGGSTRRRSPACACSRGSGHMSRGKRPCVRAQCKVERGSGGVCAALQRCGHSGAAAAERRRRCFGLGCGLRSLIASAKGGGERADAHRGLGAADMAVQRGRRQCRAVGMGRSSWRGWMQGASELLDPTA